MEEAAWTQAESDIVAPLARSLSRVKGNLQRLQHFRVGATKAFRAANKDLSVDPQRLIDRLHNLAESDFPDTDQNVLQEAIAAASRDAEDTLPRTESQPQKPSDYDWREGTISAADLRHQSFKPVQFIVKHIFAEGLNILASKPKVGKSWMALDIALTVAGIGGSVLGDYHPAAGDVLGLFLEDNKRRMKTRIEKLLGPHDEWPDRLTIKNEWRRLDEGGLGDIEEWCRESENPKLVIVDTLARVRPATKGKASAYEQDTAALAGLQKLALDFGICILVLHHQRKMESEDPFDTVSGTLGLTGVADVLAVLARQTTGVALHVTGRDVEQAELAVTFNREICRWEVLGSGPEVRRSDERKRIIDALAKSKEPMSVKEIFLAAGMKTQMATERTLGRMVQAGEIERPRRGFYTLSGLSERSEAKGCPNV